MAPNERLAILIITIVTSSWPVAAPSADRTALPPGLQQKLLLREYREALPELERLADSGDPEAQYQLALCRLEGSGSAEDPGAAVSLLRDAAASGHVKANYLLGSMFYQGRVVEADMSAARRYLSAAADQGHNLARSLLARIEDTSRQPVLDAGHASDRLWAAARAGVLKSAADALSMGADLDAPDPAGETALIIAINSRRDDMAIWLLERGANPDKTDGSGDSPLHLAARQNMEDVCRHLIEAGAGIDSENVDGRTPLMLAVAQRHGNLAQQLITAGASPEHADHQGRTARDLAAHLGDPEMARVVGPHRPAGTLSRQQRLALLRRQVGERDTLYYRWPLVAAAVAQDETDLALYLVKDGHDPWLPAPSGVNAVFLAVERGHETVARAFLTAAPVRDEHQKVASTTLLALAAGKGDEHLVGDLLGTIPPDSVTLLPLEQTPLWQAISSGQSATALPIIRWQVPDPRRDDRGMDLLLLASERGLTDVILALLSRGFGLDTSDNTGRTAAWFAADQSHCELLATLFMGGAAVDAADREGQTPLMRSVLAGAPKCVARAIAAGADVDRQTRNGNTALMLAAESHPQIVRLLLDAGADYEMRNNSSYTALMLAASGQCVDCVDALIAAGANARRKNAKGVSALDIAGDDPALLAALRR